jgi:hypothetical protein
MSLANEIFRRAGLPPTAVKVGSGYCGCDPRAETSLYKANGRLRCDVCSVLNQAFPNGDKMTRMTDGSFLLITPDQITFWGNCRLDQINPQIKVRSAAGEMTDAIIKLIINPPPTPWLSYTFSKSNSQQAIRVTEDNRLIRFGGKMQIRQQLVPEINRDQVMAMWAIGLSAKEWDAVMQEYALDQGRKVMGDMEKRYPALAELRVIPPLNSPEYLALSLILKPKKGKAANGQAV